MVCVSRDACIVDRRVWENKEVGHGYQHRTVVRQAAASFDKVKIKDMSKGTDTHGEETVL